MRVNAELDGQRRFSGEMVGVSHEGFAPDKKIGVHSVTNAPVDRKAAGRRLFGILAGAAELGQPPDPVPRLPGVFPSPVAWCLIASIAGATAYLATLFRFLTYTERNKLDARNYISFAIAVLVVGFVAALRAGRMHYRIASCVVLGVLVAHAGVIAMDLRKDPTDHNLLPFEFILLVIWATPAYIGAAVAHLAKFLKSRLKQTTSA